MPRRREQPRDDFEETFAGEPLPIRFGQPADDFGSDADVTGRILFPPPDDAPSIEMLAPIRPRPRRTGNGLVRGLILGCVIGAVAGGFVALALSRWQTPPKTIADNPPAVLAQSLTPSPLTPSPLTPSPLAAPPVAPEPLEAALVPTPPPAAPPTARRAPIADPPSAPIPQAGDAIGLRPAAEEPTRLAPTVTASARTPAEAPPAIAPAPADRLTVASLTPPQPVAKPAAAPSFDCGSARSRAEQTICGDPALAFADRRLLQAYDRAMAGTKDRAGLHEDQAQWLSARDQIGGDREALSAAYQARIRDLEAYDRRNRRAGLAKLLP